MKEKQIHIYVIALILAGPIVTLIAKQVNTFDFLYYIFPVTINSIDLRVNPELSRELRIAEMIFPLFNIKIIVFGIIALTKLIIGNVDKAFLKRFYIMTILIISIRQILIPFYYETVGQYYYFGLLGNLLWIIVLVWIIKKRTHNNVYAQF